MKKQALKLLTMSFQNFHESKKGSFRVSLLLFCALFISGCNSSLYHRGRQCSPVFIYTDESRKLIDADLSYCSIRDYEFSIHHVGPVPGTDRKEKISYCDRCVGFKDYAKTATFWEEVRREIIKDKAGLTREID